LGRSGPIPLIYFIMEIIAANLSKSFGDKKVLDTIDLSLRGGMVYCLLGRNGAGKSTLINLLSDLLDPDTGTISINGESFKGPGATNLKKTIGLQSQLGQLVEELNVFEYLELVGNIYRLPKQEMLTRRAALLSFFFHDEKIQRDPIGAFSAGMKKKAELCAAFLHRPEFVLLDEPFSSLDTIAANSLCEMIRAYSDENRVILVSSHDLLYVEKIATHAGILQNGHLVFNDSIKTLLADKQGLEKHLLKYLDYEADSENTPLKDII
jgi:ABC-2 type transport system ATP-binding protein